MKTLLFVSASIFFPFITVAQIITTVVGTGVPSFSGEGGPATNAEIYTPSGITSDNSGNYYYTLSAYPVIQKVNPAGIVSRFAGTGFNGYGGDGGPATSAQLSYAIGTKGLTADAAGNIYLTDGSRVRKVNTSGIISTVAGNIAGGSSGDGNPATAAFLRTPSGLCIDKYGRLYIADEADCKVRMVDLSGNIHTIAGNGSGGFSGDGLLATDAQLKQPLHLAVDDSLNLYINDIGNDRIRKVDKTGVISTFAGGDTTSMYCEGCPATGLTLRSTSGVAFDGDGNIYISASQNQVIYKVNKLGKIYSIAGDTQVMGFAGDGLPATAARFKYPCHLHIDAKKDLYVADMDNYRIRKIWYSVTDTPPAVIAQSGLSELTVYPNPVFSNNFTCNMATTTDEDATLVVGDLFGRPLFTTSFVTNHAANISLPLPSGMYFISATTASGLKMSAKIVVE